MQYRTLQNCYTSHFRLSSVIKLSTTHTKEKLRHQFCFCDVTQRILTGFSINVSHLCVLLVSACLWKITTFNQQDEIEAHKRRTELHDIKLKTSSLPPTMTNYPVTSFTRIGKHKETGIFRTALANADSVTDAKHSQQSPKIKDNECKYKQCMRRSQQNIIVWREVPKGMRRKQGKATK